MAPRLQPTEVDTAGDVAEGQNDFITAIRLGPYPFYHDAQRGPSKAFLDLLAQRLQVHTKVNGEHLNETSMLSWLAFHKMAMDGTVAPNNPTQPDTFIWWWILPGATKKRLTDLPASAHLPIRQKYLDLYCRAASAPVRARTAKSRRPNVKPPRAGR
jgi:hypothetical protein